MSSLLSAEDLPPLPPVLGNPAAKLAEDWKERVRPAAFSFFERQVYGRCAVGRPEVLEFAQVGEDVPMMEGKARRRIVEIRYGATEEGPRGKIRLVTFLPTAVKGPVPTMLLMCYRGEGAIDEEREAKPEFWPAEAMVDRGYAAAVFLNHDVDPDEDDGFKNGVHGLFDGGKRTGESWGAVAAWGWGASRVMDYFEGTADFDEEKVALVGFSRGGKAALWAGARDERFAMVVSNESGCTGAALAKRKLGERVARINTVFPHWFCGNYKTWNDREDEMPFDQHQLIALVAPRLVYVASAEKDLWSDPEGEFLAAREAGPVYELFGLKGVGAREMPEVGRPLHEGHVGYHLRAGKHNLLAEDWGYFMDFADRHWK
ncbi:MAG: glucuronyl esterase domain-containing protein [Verrucomicrobiaceae bacterium]